MISIFKRHRLSSKPPRSSQALLVFLLFSTFRSNLFLRSITKPYQPLPTRVCLQNKPAPTAALLRPLSASSLHRFFYFFPLLALTGALSVFYPHSLPHPILSKAQPALPLSAVSVRISLELLLLSELVKQFSSVPLIPLASKKILKPQAQTHFTLTTQISYSILFQNAPQFAYTLLPLPIGRASDSWTVTRLWSPPATSTACSSAVSRSVP